MSIIQLENNHRRINTLEEIEILKSASSKYLLNNVIAGQNDPIYKLLPTSVIWTPRSTAQAKQVSIGNRSLGRPQHRWEDSIREIGNNMRNFIRLRIYSMCVCVCVCVYFIFSLKLSHISLLLIMPNALLICINTISVPMLCLNVLAKALFTSNKQLISLSPLTCGVKFLHFRWEGKGFTLVS